MYVEIVLVVTVYASVKTVESIAVPSDFVTYHVCVPHDAIVQPLPTQLASESTQLKIVAVLLTLYYKAGVANLVVLIVKTSVRQGLVISMKKSFVLKIVGQSVYCTYTRIV